jgi:hypothetical protein
VCVCGDFNVVPFLDERRSSRVGSRPVDHISFNRFMEDTFLIDLPLSGRMFTWYKGDGTTMSRLDRFLLFEEWCLTWGNFGHLNFIISIVGRFILLTRIVNMKI